MTTEYFCRTAGCDWHGDKPSITDASFERTDPFTGQVTVDRRHLLVCPKCFVAGVDKREVRRGNQVKR